MCLIFTFCSGYCCAHNCRYLMLVCCVVSVANSVYMYEAPPPYPGIDPNLSAAYPPPPQVNGHYPANAAPSAPHPDGQQTSAAGPSLTVAFLQHDTSCASATFLSFYFYQLLFIHMNG